MAKREMLKLYGDRCLHPIADEDQLGPLLEDILGNFQKKPQQDQSWNYYWFWQITITASIYLNPYPQVTMDITGRFREGDLHTSQSWQFARSLIRQYVDKSWKTTMTLEFQTEIDGTKLVAKLMEDGRWHVVEADNLGYLEARKLLAEMDRLHLFDFEYTPR